MLMPRRRYEQTLNVGIGIMNRPINSIITPFLTAAYKKKVRRLVRRSAEEAFEWSSRLPSQKHVYLFVESILFFISRCCFIRNVLYLHYSMSQSLHVTHFPRRATRFKSICDATNILPMALTDGLYSSLSSDLRGSFQTMANWLPESQKTKKIGIPTLSQAPMYVTRMV